MFTIMDDGIALQAELDMPEKAEGEMPVAVLMHGFTGYKEEWHILAVSKALTEAGFGKHDWTDRAYLAPILEAIGQTGD